MAQKPKGMHPEDIKSALRIRYGSLKAFAIKIGRAEGTVGNAIGRPGYSVPIEREIAKALAMAPEKIWPERYHSDGSPVSMTVDRTPTALRTAAHRQNEVAA
ncbi:helix-turn-helix domain-containing protein [Acetobacter sp. DsW_063]|uniref:helix-turn-helix domain-containing protein n=1 Tax=Acetobacter sp. DsW_063 TaxID=1514894 RepID=UPI000A39A85E|nr:helix-turn-helix domain-containing protein [Acetobacter sp. DsW_063]